MSNTSPPSWVSPLARAGYAGKGIVYAVIGIFALMLAFGYGVAYAALGIAAFTGLGGSGGSGGDKKEEAAAKALTFPGANWVIGIIGLAIIAAGIFQWVKLYKGSYRSKFTLDSFAAGKRHWVDRLAKLGLGARGVIFIIIGISVLTAGWQFDPGEVMGLGEALGMFLDQIYGAILLGLVALVLWDLL